MHSSGEVIHPIESLLMTNSAAAEIIANDQEGLDGYGADLIMRNLAVITDRLSASEFDCLPKGVKDQVYAITFMADDIAPISEQDSIRHPHEDDEAYNYRMDVWQRIHNLQAYVHTRGHDKNDPHELSKIRFVVDGASHAFAAVLEATKGLPAVAETVGYFRGNANAAAKRAAQISLSRTIDKP